MRQLRVLIVTATVMAATAMPATAAPPTCTNPAVTCYAGTAENGSTFKAEVPPDWNGTLLLFSHGYVPFFLPNPPAENADNRAIADHLLAEGFALAGSSYASSGWAVEDALRDQIDLLERFEDRFGKPRRTIAWGTSMGGMVTAGRRAGRSRLLKQLWVDRPGHCTFTDAERLAALDVLLERIDRGRWPKDADEGFAAYEPPPFLRPFDLAWPWPW